MEKWREQQPLALPKSDYYHIDSSLPGICRAETQLHKGFVKSLIVFALLVASYLKFYAPYSRPTPLPSSIKWTPSLDNPAYLSAVLTVPKDYLNSAGYSKIAMIKVPATCEPTERLGAIFLNPGGPGGSGISLALRIGSNLSKLFEGRYDLIGFDPRGIGKSEPLTACYATTLDYELFKAGTVLERGFDIPHDPFSEVGYQHLLDQHRQLLALKETEFKKCEETMGEELRYMGTSTVVRDIEEMSRVLEGPKAKINFIGFSYGTVLGAFLVNMIPEKIGRVVIDGVASAPQWANQYSHEWLHDWMVDTDTAFNWFLRDCHAAGPQSCKLSRAADKDSSAISKRLFEFIDKLYDTPLAVPDAVRPGVLNSGGARALLYISTNRPGAWPLLAAQFDKAMNGDPTELYNALVRPFTFDPSSRSQTDLSRAAVACADSPPFKSKDDWPTAELMVATTLAVLNDTNLHFGASVSLIEPDGGCQFWSASGRTPERFTGPWNSTLSTPMLIISNTADPITPLASGREINKLLGNSSRLLIQNSPGHCSLSGTSASTAKVYRNYFVHGILPENEEMSEIDEGYFPVGTKGEGAEMMFETEEVKELRDISRGMSKAWEEFMEVF